MNDKISLENIRKKYILSEAYQDLSDTLKKQDYKTAKVCAQSMYNILFDLYQQQTEDEKRDSKIKLDELSDLIDFINNKLIFGCQSQ